ncbi:DUF4236 domain-containing protein [Comamonas kerstersii]|uniref:DUF4236 domain-containing protein n=1 Tax=Comamonas kerstersii TaxID=225992 RepID=UPI001B31FD77|nr:DUF4236 domain-containing protein [Comamonas kerstersii]QTW19993.1 DUF4236 domain-containing protein [Comamonas kerstersii]
MGVTFAKSVKVGVLRFNFSGRGIGVSAGIPGLRVGIGPRGAYIGGGAYGFRYRQSLLLKSTPQKQYGNTASPSVPMDTPAPEAYTPYDLNIIATQTHDDQCVLQLSDCTDQALLSMLNEQRNKSSTWPVAAFVFAIVWIGFVTSALPSFVSWIVFFLGCAFTYWVHIRDVAKKTAVLFFDLDDKAEARFENLCNEIRSFSSVSKLQAIKSTAQYLDTRYTGGAGQGVSLVAGSVTFGDMPGVSANVAIPQIASDTTTIAFCPDRVLLFQKSGVGAVEYKNLSLEVADTRFHEDGVVPRDATIVGNTWRFVNNNGTPDRRFKDNKEIPICRYSNLQVATRQGGLDVRFLASKSGAFDRLPERVAEMEIEAPSA